MGHFGRASVFTESIFFNTWGFYFVPIDSLNTTATSTPFRHSHLFFRREWAMNNNESMLGEPKTQEGGDSSSEFDDCEKEIYVRWSSREEDKFPADEDDDDDDTEEDDALLLGRQKEGANSVGNDSNPRWSRFLWLVNKRWFPDSTLRICGAEMLEVEGVKLLKFFLTTIIGIIFVHNYAQWTVSLVKKPRTILKTSRRYCISTIFHLIPTCLTEF
jgi:hypothetical protein